MILSRLRIGARGEYLDDPTFDATIERMTHLNVDELYAAISDLLGRHFDCVLKSDTPYARELNAAREVGYKAGLIEGFKQAQEQQWELE